MFKTVQNVLNVLKARKEPLASKQVGVFQEYNIYESNRMIAAYCNIGHTIPGVLIYKSGIFGTKQIVVNEAFQKLPKYMQEAMFHHEVGHDKCGHLSLILSSTESYKLKMGDIFLGTGNYLTLEFEADKYAAEIVGVDVMVETLSEIKYHLPDVLSKRLMNHRIKKVKSYGIKT